MVQPHGYSSDAILHERSSVQRLLGTLDRTLTFTANTSQISVKTISLLLIHHFRLTDMTDNERGLRQFHIRYLRNDWNGIASHKEAFCAVGKLAFEAAMILAVMNSDGADRLRALNPYSQSKEKTMTARYSDHPLASQLKNVFSLTAFDRTNSDEP
jgi:hypothetical protein